MANTSIWSGIPRKRQTSTIKNGPALIEDVRSRAYELYESRGRKDGHDVDDWLLAEQQVTRLAGPRKQHSQLESIRQ